MTRSQPACCQGDHLLSCNQFELDTDSLGDEELHLEPLNTTLRFKGMVGDSDHSFHYSNDHLDFIITLQRKNGDAYGHAALDDGRSYVIEFCGKGIHALKELDVQNLGEDEGEDFEEEGSSRILTPNNRDTTTIVTYTVKVYYTPQFAASTSDIDGFIDRLYRRQIKDISILEFH